MGSVRYKATETAPICTEPLKVIYSIKLGGRENQQKLCNLGTTVRTRTPHGKADFESVPRGTV